MFILIARVADRIYTGARLVANYYPTPGSIKPQYQVRDGSLRLTNDVDDTSNG